MKQLNIISRLRLEFFFSFLRTLHAHSTSQFQKIFIKMCKSFVCESFRSFMPFHSQQFNHLTFSSELIRHHFSMLKERVQSHCAMRVIWCKRRKFLLRIQCVCVCVLLARLEFFLLNFPVNNLRRTWMPILCSMNFRKIHIREDIFKNSEKGLHTMPLTLYVHWLN